MSIRVIAFSSSNSTSANVLASSVLPTPVGPKKIKLPIGLVVFVVATYISALITGQILKPVRTFFNRLEVDETKHILGQVVIVRSAIVNKDRGEGFMSDGGAGLLLNIRATGDEEF